MGGADDEAMYDVGDSPGPARTVPLNRVLLSCLAVLSANTSHGAVLVAAMYITSPGGPTPQPGGCLTQWHVHTNLCLAAGRVVGVTGLRSAGCPAGSSNRVTPAMMHVWYVPIPGGPTAIDATNAQIVQAAEQVSASG